MNLYYFNLIVFNNNEECLDPKENKTNQNFARTNCGKHVYVFSSCLDTSTFQSLMYFRHVLVQVPSKVLCIFVMSWYKYLPKSYVFSSCLGTSTFQSLMYFRTCLGTSTFQSLYFVYRRVARKGIHVASVTKLTTL